MTDPLQSFYRTPKTFVSLPSGNKYYDEKILKDPNAQEVGVLAMTAHDEVMMKNPDALLNGKAISHVIASCVPDVLDPTKLLKPDIDTLMIAIRLASFGKTIDVAANCPKCEKENEFEVDVEAKLQSIQPLEDEYSVTTSANVKIVMQPFDFNDSLEMQRQQFEQYKLSKNFDRPEVTDEQRLHMFSHAIESISTSSLKLVVNSITHVETPNGDVVTDKNSIAKFIDNIDRATYNSLQKTIESMGQAGVSTTHAAQCQHCKHEWELDIDYNPVSFFTES